MYQRIPRPKRTVFFHEKRAQTACVALRLIAVSLLGGIVPPLMGAQAIPDFNRDIRPILSGSCWVCHGPDESSRKASLRLDIREHALRPGESGKPALNLSDPDKSEILRRVRSSDPTFQMPPSGNGKPLTQQQIQTIRDWIAAGAPYDKHWAYKKPVRPAPPAVVRKGWVKHEFDHFILARLEKMQLAPSPEADRWTLARRLALDLTGIPPTLEQAQKFVGDVSADAYERLVDGLLASPAFGEHWARVWLDLARYADSAGYADDPLRTIWPFRDYVIRAFNANLSFDRFTLEQLAGDLLPDADDEKRTATAFHRNTMTNSEGGTDDEEFRNAAIVDRVNTTMTVWMGTSMACAQCHTHKYDPLTQEEYFKMFAIFNNTEDADRPDEAPLLDLSPPSEKAARNEIESELKRLENVAKQGKTSERSNRIAELKRDLSKFKPLTVPVMRELPDDKRRVTQIHERGNFRTLGAKVTPGVPAVFHPLPADAPADRLALAKWLMAEQNPLTARVLANRIYEQIFGVGLVRTSEEFGTQGEPPSYPELLDWLATEVVRQKWDLKQILKLLVTSATYRQNSAVSDKLREMDPENLLLARGPRFRMSGEVVRDQALFVSDLLSGKMYGPPVRPPQPSLGLSAAFGSTLDWKPSEGEDRYRRSLYTEWRRTNPFAALATFDAPSRETCVVRRPRSNTPLQALVTMNDPMFIEAAQALARRAAAYEGSDADKVRHVFQLCLIRPPSEAEALRIQRTLDAVRARLHREPGTVEQLLACPASANGQKPSARPADQESAVQLAAWAVVASSLLNLDEMMMRP